MRFAHLKVQHRFERMRLRGLTGARDEFILAAIAQNLKTLANQTWRPPINLSRRTSSDRVSGVSHQSGSCVIRQRCSASSSSSAFASLRSGVSNPSVNQS